MAATLHPALRYLQESTNVRFRDLIEREKETVEALAEQLLEVLDPFQDLQIELNQAEIDADLGFGRDRPPEA